MAFEIDTQSTIAIQSFTRNTSAKTPTQPMQQPLQVIARPSLKLPLKSQKSRQSNRFARALCLTGRSQGSGSVDEAIAKTPENSPVRLHIDLDIFSFFLFLKLIHTRKKLYTVDIREVFAKGSTILLF
jgi:hypothetical protein